MNRLLILCILFMLLIFPAAGQSVEPDEPDIVLPDVVLQLEGLPADASETVVPEDMILYEPELSPVLPDAEELAVSGEMLEVPLLDKDTPAESQANAFYAEGVFGLGLVSHLISDLTLYKLGLEPRFSLHMKHETLDGFNGNEAGTGYSSREDALDLEISYKDEKIGTDFSVNYLEKETGMQTQGSFYSRIQRFYMLDGRFVFYKINNAEFSVGGNVGYLNTDMTGAASDLFWEFTAYPSFKIDVRGENSFFDSELFYQLRQIDDGTVSEDKHAVRLDLSAGYEFKNGMSLSGIVGARWVIGDTIWVPFRITFEGNITESSTFSVSGGLKDETPRYLDIYKYSPYLDSSSMPEREIDWFGKLSTAFRISNVIRAEISAQFDAADSMNVPDFSSQDPLTALYGMTVTDAIMLTAVIDTEWKLSRGFMFTIGWKSQVLPDINPYEAAHQLDFTLSLATPDDKLGLDTGLLWQITDAIQSPEISVDAYYEIADGIKFILEGQDILVPILNPGGRTRFGDFIEPGLVLTIKTQISL